MHTPESVMKWLYENYTGPQVAGQPHVITPNHVKALASWCNATRNLKLNLSKRDRAQAEASVARGEVYLHLVTSEGTYNGIS